MTESMDHPFVPPATFEFLVASLKMQAEVQLGILHLGEESERPQPNLPLARHAIDMLAMIQEKTKGNLSWPEQRDIDNAVTELRIRYVQTAGRVNAAPPAAEDAPAVESSESGS